MSNDLTSPESTNMIQKYYKVLQAHIKEEDISNALNCLRVLLGEAKSRKNLNRPMVQLLAAKALLEYNSKVAEMEIADQKRPDGFNQINIYNVKVEDSDSIIDLSKRLNAGLSHSVKR